MDDCMSSQDEATVTARRADLRRAEAIACLLVRPIGILPKAAGDPIPPFALGLWSEIRWLMRREAGVGRLRRATPACLHPKAYHIAVSMPGSTRHDLDGKPFADVSPSDRQDAKDRAAAEPAEPPSNSDLIRAGPLRRKSQEPGRFEVYATDWPPFGCRTAQRFVASDRRYA